MSGLHLAMVRPAAGQVRTADVAAVAGAGLVFLAPHLLGVRPRAAACAPCDPATLPAFDRWALAPDRPGWSAASWIVGAVAVGLPVLDLWNEGDAGRARAAAVVEAASWAVAGTELLKVAFSRSRPVLYRSPLVPGAADDADNRRSFPSGHTAGAVAAATVYWLSRRDLDGRTRAAAWIPAALALGTGVMRITAGKHFPSDVAGGFAVGILSAIVVHEVRL